MKVIAQYSLKALARGDLTLFYFSQKEGRKDIITLKNLIVYGGADILAKVLAGNADYAINTMYLEYSNVAITSGPAITRSRDASYYAGLQAAANVGYSRFPTLSNAEFSAYNSDYDHNEVRFIGISDGSYESGGAPLTDNVSKIYGAGLVAAPDWADQTKDILFSAVNLEVGGTLSPITKIANASIGVEWKIRFN